MTTDRADVVIVGGGVAGGALSTALARAGMDVVVLEHTTEYVDRVRGEYLHPWGVAEAQRLGVYDDLIAAGGNLIARLVGYDEAFTPAEAEAEAAPLDLLMPGVPGAMGIGHPVACRALEAASLAAGARVVNGVEHVEVASGASPSVRYVVGDTAHEVEARIVVGADGRSSVVRRQAGIEVQRTQPQVALVGLLVEQVHDWPAADGVLGTVGDSMLFVFPQRDGKARLYLGHVVDDRSRFADRDHAQVVLDAFRVTEIPDSERLAQAVPAGPCESFPMFATWPESPIAAGIVLIGDAAGFSDPSTGSGLSIALRDARMVSEALLGSEDRSPHAFAEYAAERTERMSRLRFACELFMAAHLPRAADEIAERRRRLELLGGGDPDLFMLLLAMVCGTELAPAESFTPAMRDRLLIPA